MCGCPLEVEFPCSLKHSRQFCRQLKKSCVKHYCWEKLRRAEVDQEKLNLVRNLPHLKIPFSCVLRLFFLLSSFSGSSSSHHFSLSFSHLSISGSSSSHHFSLSFSHLNLSSDIGSSSSHTLTLMSFSHV